jgi:hypothetical protein
MTGEKAIKADGMTNKKSHLPSSEADMDMRSKRAHVFALQQNHAPLIGADASL